MSDRVPFLDVGAGYRELGPELDAAARRVLASGHYVLGPEVERFEQAFAAYCGAAHCAGVASGLDALELSLRALGVGPGDEVIVPGNTYIATWLAVSAVGARPVPVEPDPATANIDTAAVARDVMDQPDVAVAGVIGAVGVNSLAWWEGAGRGRVVETRGTIDFGGGRHDTDTVDGLLMVLSPWAVKHLRFDQHRFSGFHGYDADLCFQARAAGRRVVVDDFAVVHHTKGGYGDEPSFRATDAAWREKWADHPVVGIAAPTRCAACATPTPAVQPSARRQIVTCARCGTGVTVPAPVREAEGAGIFEEQYGGGRLAQREQWFAEARVRLGWVGSRVAPGSTLLDVGCATGELPATAAEQGHAAVGVEPSTWAAEQARRLGVEAWPGVEELLAERPGLAVDAITLFHVLEHVHEPLELLRGLRAALRPAGLLFVEVPNYGARDAQLDPVRWTGPALDDHVAHYTGGSLRRLLDEAGFDVLDEHAFTYREYDSPELWQRRMHAWAAAGLDEPSEDLLRVLAAPRG